MSQGVDVGGIVLSLPVWTPFAAVAISGLAGATYAARRGFDIVGVLSLAIATGTGGLLLRDVLLQQGVPVILADPRYLITAAAAAVVGFFFAGLISQIGPAMVILDGLSLGFLSTLGAGVTLRDGLSWQSAIFIGTVTALGGLLLRDVMAGVSPEVMRPGVFYGVVALLASVLFVLLVSRGANPGAVQMVTMIFALILRGGGEWLGWNTAPALDISDRIWDVWQRHDKKADATEESHAASRDRQRAGSDADQPTAAGIAAGLNDLGDTNTSIGTATPDPDQERSDR